MFNEHRKVCFWHLQYLFSSPTYSELLYLLLEHISSIQNLKKDCILCKDDNILLCYSQFKLLYIETCFVSTLYYIPSFIVLWNRVTRKRCWYRTFCVHSINKSGRGMAIAVLPYFGSCSVGAGLFECKQPPFFIFLTCANVRLTVFFCREEVIAFVSL